MRPKAVIKIVIDIGMTLALLFLMGYQFWGDAAHEWAGTGMFLLFILHNLLNRGWYGNLFRGKYTPFRALQLAVNILLLIAMLGLMASGIILSNHVFRFVNIRGGMGFARLLHMAASYWGFALMALHLGLHWKMFLGMADKAFHLQPSRKRKGLLMLMGTGVFLYGFAAFIRRRLLDYMLLKTQFVFLDFNEPLAVFYLDYLSMMGAFIFLAHYAALLVKGKREKN